LIVTHNKGLEDVWMMASPKLHQRHAILNNLIFVGPAIAIGGSLEEKLIPFARRVFGSLTPAMMAMQAAPKCVVEHKESDPSGEIGGEGSDDDDDDVPPLEPLEDCEGDRSEQEESADETIDDEGAESDEMEHSEDMECSEEEEHREDPAPKTPDLKKP